MLISTYLFVCLFCLKLIETGFEKKLSDFARPLLLKDKLQKRKEKFVLKIEK
eukprot:m.79360 g.79360  ORF g.79360 m.79360 type:complete len:52 (+) comp11975_c1_seq32:3244-3399(+)